MRRMSARMRRREMRRRTTTTTTNSWESLLSLESSLVMEISE